MTTIGSTPYALPSRYTVIDNQQIARKPTADEAGLLHSPVAPANIESGIAALVADPEHDDTDTFLYDRAGKLSEPSPAIPTGPSGRFASVYEENLFLRDATKEELTEVYGAQSAELTIKGREGRPQAIAAYEQMLAKLKRDNPGFIANTFKGQAQETVSRIEEHLEQFNIYQQILADPGPETSMKALAASWAARYWGMVQDLSEALRSNVNVTGDLIRQKDDGTYVLSNFTLSYDGAQFFKHEE